MKKLCLSCLFLLVGIFILNGCSLDTYFLIQLTKSKISVSEAMKVKGQMDITVNPAKRSEYLADLRKKMISVSDTLVKRVTVSTNIDYEFCVIIESEYEKGIIECYVYTKDKAVVAELEAGITRISCKGDFSKFFTSVEDSYQKIELTNSDISVIK